MRFARLHLAVDLELVSFKPLSRTLIEELCLGPFQGVGKKTLAGIVIVTDNNGPLLACFHVMCREAAPRQSRATHPQTIEHLRSTLWLAPSQTVRCSQAARRRLRRRALIFRLGARAALVGPPGLAKYGTLVNVITSGEHGLEKTDGITFEEQGTDSRTCDGDSTVFYNADVNTNVVGLITDCTGDSGAIAGVPDRAAMGWACNLVSSTGNL